MFGLSQKRAGSQKPDEDKARAAFSDLRSAFEGPTDLGAFLDVADGAQRALFEALRSTYGHDAFSKTLALKLSNLAVARRLYAAKETALASRPVQLMLDPANNCQLHCPGCVHTSTEEVRRNFDWPGGLLEPETYERYMATLGPFAFSAVFYNYGEPLLNVHTTDYVRTAKSYLLSTIISTNLMLVRDADDLVASGLDCLIASIDGASQETYETYRRGGNLSDCLGNMRRIVEAKRRLGSETPYIVWQFLTFEHNVHEVDRALALARELGVNELLVATPFDVGFDDPSVRSVEAEKAGRYVLRPGPTRRHDLEQIPGRSPAVDDHFDRPWASRLPAAASWSAVPVDAGPTCGWLYQSMTIDARGRVTPCCGAPSIGLPNYVYGNLGDENADGDGDWFNSERYGLARLAYRNRHAFDGAVKAGLSGAGRRERLPAPQGALLPVFDDGGAPYCASCTRVPPPVYETASGVPSDVREMDPRGVLPMSEVEFWSAWP